MQSFLIQFHRLPFMIWQVLLFPGVRFSYTDSNAFYKNVLCRFKKIWHHIIGMTKCQVACCQNSRYHDFHQILEFLSATRKLPDQFIWHLHQFCVYTRPKYCGSLGFVHKIGWLSGLLMCYDRKIIHWSVQCDATLIPMDAIPQL